MWDSATHDYITAVPNSERVTVLARVTAGHTPRVASGHSHGRVVLWSLHGLGAGQTRRTPQLWRQLCSSDWSPAHGVPTGSGERVTCLTSCVLPALSSLDLPADEAIFVGFSDGTVQAFLASTTERLRTWQAHSSSVTDLVAVVSSAGIAAESEAANALRLVSASRKGTLRNWTIMFYEERRALAWRSLVSQQCLRQEHVDIVIGTYNVNAERADGDGASGIGGLREWLDWKRLGGRKLPAIYAIGLQEVVPLTASEILSVRCQYPAI